MANISLKNVYKVYDQGNTVVKDFNLDILDKEFVIFVGPSGCGKSTTLRMIAGLEEITDGELWVDGQLSNYCEPQEREMSMVFQNYALYPNMTVYENMAYALKIRKMPKQEINRIVKQVAEKLEISHLLRRRPNALSGGQKQRVAIGSAIVRKPKAFLMDEPLSNLDAKLRAQMRVELSKLHKELETTIVYVTHDQIEAMTLGTRIVVMKEGVIQQADTPTKIYQNPANLFVAGFIGSPSMNFFKAKVAVQDGKTVLLFGGQDEKKVFVDGKKAQILQQKCNQHVIVGIRPEDIYDEEGAVERSIQQKSVGITETVVARELLGSEVYLYYEMEGENVAVRLKPTNKTQVGQNITLYFDPEKLHVFDQDTEQNIFYAEEVQQ